jgi:hypothetical protein
MCVICRSNTGSNEIDETTTIINCERCPDLTSLEPIRKCKALEELDCAGCILLTSLEGLENCEKLKELNCSACPLINLKGLENCQSSALERLWCCFCIKLVSLEGLENCKALKEITCTDCSSLVNIHPIDKLRLIQDFRFCKWVGPFNSKIIKKIVIIQQSCQKFLFRKRMITKRILSCI